MDMLQVNFKQLALKKISKLFIGITLVIFFILATYGANLSWNGHMNGEMKGCQLMAEMEQICQMDVMEHIAGWQKLFLAAFQSNSFQFLLLSVAMIAAAFWFLGKLRIFSPLYAFLTPQSAYKKEIGGSPHDYLLQSFSNGILRKRE